VEAYPASLALLSTVIEVHKTEAVDADLASESIWSSVHGIAGLGLSKRLRYRDWKHSPKAAVETLSAGMRALHREAVISCLSYGAYHSRTCRIVTE